MEILQVHLSSPSTLATCQCFNKPAITPDINGENTVAHGKYIYNLCRGNNDYQISSVVDELTEANKYGIDLVIHQGKNIESEGLTRLGALQNYISSINSILSQTSHLTNTLLLENSARQGTELGYNLAELGYILSQIEDPFGRVKLCIDTCHAFVAGVCDFRDIESVHKFIGELVDDIGLEKIGLIHLNDSAIGFGGCNDHHADFMSGFITNPMLGGNSDGLKLFLNVFVKSHNIPYVFETPENIVNITDQRKYIHCLMNDLKGNSVIQQSVYESLGFEMFGAGTKNKKKMSIKLKTGF